MTVFGAVVLSGGRSLRMGRPKEWLPFGPEFLLQRVVRLVGDAADPVVVVAAPDQDLPELPGSVAIVRDPVADRGPLQGLAAGLAALPDRVDLVYVTTVDAPFLAPAWIERLGDLIGDQDLAIPDVGGRLHPLSSLYRRAPALRAAGSLLDRDRLRVVGLLEVVRARVVEGREMEEIDPVLGSLRNLNTPEDYRRALGDAGLS